jgi:hypothetical protein
MNLVKGPPFRIFAILRASYYLRPKLPSTLSTSDSISAKTRSSYSTAMVPTASNDKKVSTLDMGVIPRGTLSKLKPATNG